MVAGRRTVWIRLLLTLGGPIVFFGVALWVVRGDGARGIVPEVVPAARATDDLDPPAIPTADDERVAASPHEGEVDPEAERLRVRVVDARGETRSGVEIATSVDGRATSHGTTGERGDLWIERPGDDVAFAILARADAADCHAERELGAPFPLEVELVLEDCASITGVVRGPGGGAVPTGTRVLVYSRQDPFVRTKIRGWIAGRQDARLRVVEPDTDGRFVVDGLASGGDYAVTAAAPGEVAVETVRAEVGSDVELELAALYAVVVHLRDGAGGPLRSQLADVEGGPKWNEGQVIVWVEERERPELWFTLLADHLPRREGPRMGEPRPDDLIMIATGPADGETLGPVLYKAEVPGYRRVQRDVELWRVRDRVAEVTIGAQANAELGRLVVEVDLPVGFEEVLAGDRRPLGWLGFGTSELYLWVAPLPHPSELPLVLEGFPYGEYSAHFTSRDGSLGRGELFARELGKIEVGPSPAELRVDLRDAGLLAVEVTLVDGGGYPGALTLGLARDQGTSWASFVRAPYLLFDPPEGDYSLVPQAARNLHIAGDPPLASVRPGVITRAIVPLVRR